MTSYEDRIAQYAQLAMVLEVCATPKPGNVDRDHNYPDTHFEHFIASAVSVYPVLKEASKNRDGIGKYIHKAVVESAKWQSGGNTHFGAFILLIPLVMAAGKLSCRIDGTPGIFPDLRAQLHELVRNTTVDDSVELYQAFEAAGVKVKHVNDLDLADPYSIGKIKSKQITLFQLMEIASSRDMIAREWIWDYRLTFTCAESILKKYETLKINDVVVWTFLETLSENPDSFIETKFDRTLAQEVSAEAKKIVESINNSGFENTKYIIYRFDEQLIRAQINPGSTADIIIAGLFTAMLGGLKF